MRAETYGFLFMGAAAALGLACSGCSFIFSRGPTAGPDVTPSDAAEKCSPSSTPPILDTVFTGTAKFAVPLGDHVRASAVGGAGGAYRRTAREGTTASLLPPASRAPFTDTVSNFVFAWSLGADVTVRISERLALFVAGRRHQLRDDDRDGCVARHVAVVESERRCDRTGPARRASWRYRCSAGGDP